MGGSWVGGRVREGKFPKLEKGIRKKKMQGRFDLDIRAGQSEEDLTKTTLY